MVNGIIIFIAQSVLTHMMNFFKKPLTRKCLFAFFICHSFMQLPVHAQTKHPKVAATKPLASPQLPPEPPNPYAAIDAKALLIPDSMTRSTEAISSYINANFHSNQDRVRAAFIWVASSIRYDVPNMYAINYYEKKEDKIAKPLQTRQGICENYAALFTDICGKTGIPGYVVEGYVKLNGQVSNLSHAWCVARIDTSWYLFDPTWAAGYVNNGTFVPKINNSFYETSPTNFIQAHMPFDCIWQLLYHPAGFTDFNNGIVKENTGGAYFNFPDSIAAYEKQSQIEKDEASYRRVDNNGAKNAQVFNRLLYLRQSIEETKMNQYNSAVTDYNNAIGNFNEFIRYRNKQFVPMRPDAEIQAMLDSATGPYNLAKMKLSQIKNPSPNIQNLMGPMQKQMNQFSDQLEEQEVWLAKYFSKGKSGRRGMFYKVTWFGIPVN
jgi:transglutaminase/protease-like cytokinesis protein 3